MSNLKTAAAVGAAVVAAGLPASAEPDMRGLRIPQTGALKLPPSEVALAANGHDMTIDGVLYPFGDTPQAERLRELLRQQPGQRVQAGQRILLVGGGGSAKREWPIIPQQGSTKPGEAGIDGGPPVDNPHPSLGDQVAGDGGSPKMPNEYKQPQAGPIYPHKIEAE